jgi:hypothetical protein
MFGGCFDREKKRKYIGCFKSHLQIHASCRRHLHATLHEKFDQSSKENIWLPSDLLYRSGKHVLRFGIFLTQQPSGFLQGFWVKRGEEPHGQLTGYLVAKPISLTLDSCV